MIKSLLQKLFGFFFMTAGHCKYQALNIDSSYKAPDEDRLPDGVKILAEGDGYKCFEINGKQVYLVNEEISSDKDSATYAWDLPESCYCKWRQIKNPPGYQHSYEDRFKWYHGPISEETHSKIVALYIRNERVWQKEQAENKFNIKIKTVLMPLYPLTKEENAAIEQLAKEGAAGILQPLKPDTLIL